MIPHPQQEYIITEERLQRFENGGYFDVLLKEIRQTPAPAAPTKEQCRKYWLYRADSGHLYHLLHDLLGEMPTEDTLGDALCKARDLAATQKEHPIKLRTPNTTKFCDCESELCAEICQKWKEQHDATIRTQTLDAVKKKIKKLERQYCCCDFWSNSTVEEILGAIKSLRTQEHERGDQR